MRGFVEGMDREQSTLFPEYLEDRIDEDNPVRAIDGFVDELKLGELGLEERAEFNQTQLVPGDAPIILSTSPEQLMLRHLAYFRLLSRTMQCAEC